MDYIGYDKNGTKLQVGDICSFYIKDNIYEGIITYDYEEFAYTFEMNSDEFPSVLMRVADLRTIEKIANVHSTIMKDGYNWYKELFEIER